MIRGRVGTGLLAVVGWTGLLTAQVDAPGLEADISALMEAAGIPGLSVGLVRAGQVVWLHGFGVLENGTSRAVGADTHFEAASLTKPVVALATLRLAGQGTVDLDRPLADLLSYSRLEHDSRYLGITPRMVLSHSSGLPNWGEERLQLLSDPGAQFGYSGEGFVFLQKALESKLGKSLQQILQEQVFGPLGMNSSAVVWREEFASTMAHGHDEWQTAQALRKPQQANAAASLLTTARDYSRFLAAVVNRELLEEALWKEMLAPAISTLGGRMGKADDQPFIDWGLGWGLEKSGPAPRFWHWGDNGNFKCFVLADPTTRNGFVYFTNSGSGLSIAGAMIARLLPGSRHVVKFIDYESHDAPLRMLRHRLAGKFLDPAGEDPWKQAEQALDTDPSAAEAIREVARVLREKGEARDAVRLLELLMSRDLPQPELPEELGDSQLEAGLYMDAIATYSLIIYHVRSPFQQRIEGKIRWAQERMEIQDSPRTGDPELLRAMVGSYGNRRIYRDSEGLWYQRQGSAPYRLLALDANTFALQGLENFRIRCVTAPDGRVLKLLGLYLDGRQDESPRDPDRE